MSSSNTELLKAVNANKLEAVRAMLLKPDALLHVNKYNCLHWAVTFGKVEMSQLLVEAGADVNALGMAGKETPLIIALTHSHFDIAEYLLKHGADPNIPSGGSSGNYPLEFTSTAHIVDMLLNHNAKVDVVNRNGQSLLFEALRSPTKLKKLLTAGADVNAADNDGYTPLIMAVEMGRDDAVKLLLQFGADIEICGPSGRSVHEIATQLSTKKLLENHRCGYNAKLSAHEVQPNSKVASAPIAPAMVVSSGEKERAISSSVPKRKSFFRSIFGTRQTSVETAESCDPEKASSRNNDGLAVAIVVEPGDPVTGNAHVNAKNLSAKYDSAAASVANSMVRNEPVAPTAFALDTSVALSPLNSSATVPGAPPAYNAFADEARFAALEARIQELERIAEKQAAVIATLVKAIQVESGDKANTD